MHNYLQALGSIFFINDIALPRIQQYDFIAKQFVKLEKVFESYDHDLLKCRMLRKAKFPKDFWPTVKWSRKGYMHCRFCIDQTLILFFYIIYKISYLTKYNMYLRIRMRL